MKTLSNVTRYRCDHCGKEYKKGHFCEKHEVACSSNPENAIACSFCQFLVEQKKLIVEGSHSDRYANSFFCSKKSIGLYPPKVVHKGLLFNHPENFEDEELMPKSCELFDPGF